MLKRRCFRSILLLGLSAQYQGCIYFLTRFKQSLSETPTGRVWYLLTSCSLHERPSSLALPCQVSTQTTPTTTSYFPWKCNSCWSFGRIYLLKPYSQHPHNNFRGIVLSLKTVDRKGGWQKPFPHHHCLHFTSYRHFGEVKNISAFKQLLSWHYKNFVCVPGLFLGFKREKQTHAAFQ